MANIDPDFGVDNFNNSKILNESETVKNNILTLLFMRPGSYPSLPQLGLDISQYLYAFFDSIDTDKLKNDIAAQCTEFIPQVQSGELNVIKTHYDNKPVLLIVIPTVVKNETTGLVVGITTDAIGNISYNTAFDNSVI